uniref:Reverse transcriptase zinc-binding domain-containing protein n=1 Tax=Setaria italica TaxID=4555 RepID=K4AM91_SETIT
HSWWSARASTVGVPRKGLKSLVILICWKVWKDRTIFNHVEASTTILSSKIKDEILTWIMRLSAWAPH